MPPGKAGPGAVWGCPVVAGPWSLLPPPPPRRLPRGVGRALWETGPPIPHPSLLPSSRQFRWALPKMPRLSFFSPAKASGGCEGSPSAPPAAGARLWAALAAKQAVCRASPPPGAAVVSLALAAI